MQNIIKSIQPLPHEHYSKRAWFCVQTHPKHEHIASRFLIKTLDVKVFNPQVRIRRATRRGPVWFIESAFPGYIFVHFNLQNELDSVRYSSGISKVVQFNSVYPCVPDFQMDEMLAVFSDKDMLVLAPQISTGDTVRINGGAFHDLLAVVHLVQPAKQRVQALLEFLGRMTSVELDLHNVTLEQRGQANYHPLFRA
jgi:transcriptional antiterminator RfaH